MKLSYPSPLHLKYEHEGTLLSVSIINFQQPHTIFRTLNIMSHPCLSDSGKSASL